MGRLDGIKVEERVKGKKVLQATQSALFHVEASQSGQLTAVAKDWITQSIEAPKTFSELQREIVAKMDRLVQERDARLG